MSVSSFLMLVTSAANCQIDFVFQILFFQRGWRLIVLKQRKVLLSWLRRRMSANSWEFVHRRRQKQCNLKVSLRSFNRADSVSVRCGNRGSEFTELYVFGNMIKHRLHTGKRRLDVLQLHKELSHGRFRNKVCDSGPALHVLVPWVFCLRPADSFNFLFVYYLYLMICRSLGLFGGFTHTLVQSSWAFLVDKQALFTLWAPHIHSECLH